jgi:hypothetical protein
MGVRISADSTMKTTVVMDVPAAGSPYDLDY